MVATRYVGQQDIAFSTIATCISSTLSLISDSDIVQNKSVLRFCACGCGDVSCKVVNTA